MGIKRIRSLGSNGEEKLVGKEATGFRALAARGIFLSLDCPDLQFGVKLVSRDMSSPTRDSWQKLKKVARYLVNRKRVVWFFRWQEEPSHGTVQSDSDWGGI